MRRLLLKIAAMSSLFVIVGAYSSPRSDVEETILLDGERLMLERCSGCHSIQADRSYSRISEQRKTPEGWFMSVVRMERSKRVVLTEDERRAIVKFLSDEYGLSPSETANYRADLEKQPNKLDPVDDADLAVMCARCHSSARIGLQRRNEAQWRHLVHFHVAQFPTLEYAAGSRDREWWRLANDEVVPRLAKKYGLESSEWSDWKAVPKKSLSGQWRVTSYQPGVGLSEGVALINSDGPDHYTAQYALSSMTGKAQITTSQALLYTGFEWRGARSVDGRAIREVFEVSKDGKSMKGRWFYQNSDEIGGTWSAHRMDGPQTLMEMYPAYIKSGQTKEITLFGIGLDGVINLGEGVSFDVLGRSNTTVHLRVTASSNSLPGARDVRVGGVSLGALKVYSHIDRIKVQPENAIARLGGGKVPAVTAQFEALAYSNGPDGIEKTADDEIIGVFPARWSKSNFDETAEHLEDSRFAGSIDQSGLFTPAEAGINPNRYIPTNNTGVLSVTAKVSDGQQVIQGDSRLVVTVQRFIDPPIR